MTMTKSIATHYPQRKIIMDTKFWQ